MNAEIREANVAIQGLLTRFQQNMKQLEGTLK